MFFGESLDHLVDLSETAHARGVTHFAGAHFCFSQLCNSYRNSRASLTRDLSARVTLSEPEAVADGTLVSVRFHGHKLTQIISVKRVPPSP